MAVRLHPIGDEVSAKVIQKQMQPADLLLGRNTFKIFDDSAMPAAFTLVESTTTPSGVIMVNYKRAGEVRVGTIGT